MDSLQNKLDCFVFEDGHVINPTKAEKNARKCWILRKEIEDMLNKFGLGVNKVSKGVRTEQQRMVKRRIDEAYRESQGRFQSLQERLDDIARKSNVYHESNFTGLTLDRENSEETPGRIGSQEQEVERYAPLLDNQVVYDQEEYINHRGERVVQQQVFAFHNKLLIM